MTHFTRSPMDEEDLAQIDKDTQANPDKFMEHDWDYITWGYLDGREFVPDCPCNRTDRYESFIWEHRRQILEYLKTRLVENVRNAEAELRCHPDAHRFLELGD